MKRRITSLAITVCMLLSMIIPAQAAGSCLATSDASLKEGDTFTLAYSVPNSVSGVDSIVIEIGFDNTKFEVTAIDYADIAPLVRDTGHNVTQANTNGQFRGEWSSNDDTFETATTAANLQLFEASFTVKAGAEAGTADFNVNILEIADEYADDLTGAAGATKTKLTINIIHTCTVESVTGQAATCTEAGWNGYYKCSDDSCGKLYSDVDCTNEITDLDAWKAGAGSIPAAHGATTAYPAVDSTCKTQGNDAYSTCNVCGVVVSGSDVKLALDATNHEGDLAEVVHNDYLVTPATCKSQAVYYKSYDCCGVASTETFQTGALAEHTYGTLIDAQVEIHTTDTLKAAVAAHYQCSVCEKYFDESHTETNLEALTGTTPVHSFGDFVNTDPENHWKACVCGLKSEEGTHIYDNVEDMVCDTCGYDRSCKHDGATTVHSANASTCKTQGNGEYVTCNSCGIVISGSDEKLPLDPANHEGDTTTHDAVDSTCKVQGNDKYITCDSCGAVVSGSDEKLALDATNHEGVLTETVAEKFQKSPATCEDKAVYYKSYDCCEAMTDDTFEAGELGDHDYGTKIDAQPEVHTPDVLQAGVAAHYQCSVCEKYFDEDKAETDMEALTGETPVHSYGDWVNTDASQHWKECTCGLMSEEGASDHDYTNVADTTCDTCGHEKTPATMSTDINTKTFVAGSDEWVEFTFSTVANDFAGIMVYGGSDFGTYYEDMIAGLEYKAGDSWINMKGQNFGGSTGFPMADATSTFRVKFTEDAAGEYTFIAAMKSVEDDSVVCSTEVPFTVQEPAPVMITINIPITKIVEKTGTASLQATTFTFNLEEIVPEVMPTAEGDAFNISSYIVKNGITIAAEESAQYFENAIQLQGTTADFETLSWRQFKLTENSVSDWDCDDAQWILTFEPMDDDSYAPYAELVSDAEIEGDVVPQSDEEMPNEPYGIYFTNTYTKNASTGGNNGGGGGGGSSAPSKPVLNKEDHMAFLQGYADGTFRPEANMTRAQVTVMFARLLVDKMEVGATYTNSFSDVPADYWAANEIGYMEKFGIINGFTDGTFRPNDPVTRAQFAAIACRFEELTEGTKTFSDVPADHWASKYISYAAERGWVGGYTDGTFRPNNYITRAQVAAVTCRLLERNADQAYIKANLDELNTYSDMTETHFAYWYALEASNGHDYTKKAGAETWVDLHN